MDQYVLVGSEAIRSDDTSLLLMNIHDPSECLGEPCVVHNPSEHHMREWLLHWRDDRGMFERICPCGIGHPDPDQMAYWVRTGQACQSVHGCCGHCRGSISHG